MKHHYVPQFLLSQWANGIDDNTIEVFRLDLVELRSDRHTPAYTGYEKDLYALSHDKIAGMNQHAVEEHFLKHIDNDAAKVRNKLEKTGLNSLNSRDRNAWVRFLMSLRVRQPVSIDNLITSSAEHLRNSLASQPDQYEELASSSDPSNLVDWVDENYPGLIDNFGLSFFHELVDNPKISDQILRMKWWLWDFSDVRHDLLLSDNPCIFTHGINDPNLIISLPVSPKKVFMATQTAMVAETLRQQKSQHLLKRINESSLLQSSSRIYARDTSHRRFIQNRFHQFP